MVAPETHFISDPLDRGSAIRELSFSPKVTPAGEHPSPPSLFKVVLLQGLQTAALPENLGRTVRTASPTGAAETPLFDDLLSPPA